MVKFTQKGSQDPADSSLQMKVLIEIRLDKAVPCDGTQNSYRSGT